MSVVGTSNKGQKKSEKLLTFTDQSGILVSQG